MTRLVDLIAEARRTRDCARLIEAVPYCGFVGISADSDDGELRGRLTYSRALVGNTALPALHGGTLGALLESTAIFKLLWEAESIVLPKTINFTIEFLRSAKPVDTFARATITRLGRRVANVRAEAWQHDPERPVAVAHGHFLIVPVAQ
jgi:acyl-coenzyme A thioesterase PaaI-like protein